jgi:hypothetical protein
MCTRFRVLTLSSSSWEALARTCGRLDCLKGEQFQAPLSTSSERPLALFETRDLHFRPEDVRDSQATFSQSLRTLMRRTYSYHCSICLNRLTVAGSECAHFLASATVSAKQVSSKDYLHHYDVIHTHHLSFQTLLT